MVFEYESKAFKMNIIGVINFIPFFAFLVLAIANQTSNITKSIAETLNEFLKEVSPENIIEKMVLHYKLLGLMDSNGEWVHNYFKTGSNGQYFLPKNNITSQDLILLVNMMAENADKNPYLINALKVLQQGNYQNLERKLKEEGDTVIVDTITLAIVLEKLTARMKENWRFWKVCNGIWLEYDTFQKFLDAGDGDLFSLAKALTIEETARRAIQILETKEVPSSAFINTLKLNIIEAVVQDEKVGYLDNAETGKIMAQYVHTAEKDNRTGSGPCKLSANQQITECAPPLTLQWVDLYTTWNLGEA